MSAELVVESANTWTIETLESLTIESGLFKDGDWVESKDQDPDGEVRLIQLADIGDGQFIDKSSRFLTKNKAKQLKCTFLKKGDLLIARMPDPLGRTCMFPLEGDEKYVTVVDVCIVRGNPEKVDTRYLMHLINSPDIRAKIDSLKSGSTRKRISRGNLSLIELPIASLEEQKDIVAKIETLFSELDKGVESLRTARQQLKAYRQAVLKHAFEGKLTEQWRQQNPDKLETPKQLLARIQQEREQRYQQQLDEWEQVVKIWGKNSKRGTSIKTKDFTSYKPIDKSSIDFPETWLTASLASIAEITGGLTKNQKRDALSLKMKYLRVANVYADKLVLDDIQEIGVTKEESKKVELRKNDLLVIEGNGSIDQIGRVALWDASVDNCGHQNHLIRVRLDNSDYARVVLLFLLSPIGRDLIVKEASSTSGLHTLSISKVSNLQIPVMPEQESKQLIALVDEKLTNICKTIEEIDVQLLRAEILRQSILKKAFSGQLIPNRKFNSLDNQDKYL